MPHCYPTLTQDLLVLSWETHLLWLGSLGENGEELGDKDLAGLWLDTGVEEHANHGAALSVSTFKGYLLPRCFSSSSSSKSLPGCKKCHSISPFPQ